MFQEIACLLTDCAGPEGPSSPPPGKYYSANFKQLWLLWSCVVAIFLALTFLVSANDLLKVYLNVNIFPFFTLWGIFEKKKKKHQISLRKCHIRCKTLPLTWNYLQTSSITQAGNFVSKHTLPQRAGGGAWQIQANTIKESAEALPALPIVLTTARNESPSAV